MNVDPAAACLRCWEHEDCIDHPELGLACASGAVTLVVGVHEHNEIAMEAYARGKLNVVFPGDGKVDPSVYDHGYGDWDGDYGDNLGNGSGLGRAVGGPEAYATLAYATLEPTVTQWPSGFLQALMVLVR